MKRFALSVLALLIVSAVVSANDHRIRAFVFPRAALVRESGGVRGTAFPNRPLLLGAGGGCSGNPAALPRTVPSVRVQAGGCSGVPMMVPQIMPRR